MRIAILNTTIHFSMDTYIEADVSSRTISITNVPNESGRNTCDTPIEYIQLTDNESDVRSDDAGTYDGDAMSKQ